MKAVTVAIFQQRCHHFRERWPVAPIGRSADASLSVDLHNLDAVGKGVFSDRFKLAGKTVALYLPFAADSEVCKRLNHVRVCVRSRLI